MRKNIMRLKYLMYILISWCIILPFSHLLGRFFRKRYILFIGRDDGRFLDNVKYLFLYFIQKQKRDNLINMGIETCFLTENKNTFFLLKNNNLPVVYFPSMKAFKILLSTKLLIVDNWMWIKNFKNFILKPAKKIQLWHGVGFKKINLMLINTFKEILIYNFIGKIHDFDVVVSTSYFYTNNVFSKAFKAKYFWETGYPRNDIFFRKLDKNDFLFTDKKALNYIRNKKDEGCKIILYAPTFRDTGGDVFTDKVLNIKKIEIFLNKIKALMIIKFHPDPNFNYQLFKDCKNILFYDNDKDVYPILKITDCLITDYSSIYMDYLLLDNPIIFFPYDYNKYITKDREIQFEYDWITTGEKAYKQEELETLLKKILVEKIDNFKEKRKEIKNIAFKYQDGLSSERIFIKVLDLLKIKNAGVYK